MSFIKERIKEIAVNKGIPLGKFFKKLGVAPSGFSGEKIKNGTNSLPFYESYHNPIKIG